MSVHAAAPETLKYINQFVHLQLPVFDLTSAESIAEDPTHAIADAVGGEANVIRGKPSTLRLPDGTTRDIQTVWKVRTGERSDHIDSLLVEVRALLGIGVHQNVQPLLGSSWRRCSKLIEGRELWDPILLMEYAPRGNLDALLRENPGIRFELKERMALDIGHGLSAVHQAGFVWGDGKPENVLVFSTNNSLIPFQLKITDFGSSKSFDELYEEHLGRGEMSISLGTKPWQSPLTVCGGLPEFPSRGSGEVLSKKGRYILEYERFDVFVFGLILSWLLLESQKFNETYFPGVNPANLPLPLFGIGNSEEMLQRRVKEINAAAMSTISEMFPVDEIARKRTLRCSVDDIDRVKKTLEVTLCWVPTTAREALKTLDRRQQYVSRSIGKPNPGMDSHQHPTFNIAKIAAHLRKTMTTRSLEKSLAKGLEESSIEEAAAFITGPRENGSFNIGAELQYQKDICRKTRIGLQITQPGIDVSIMHRLLDNGPTPAPRNGLQNPQETQPRLDTPNVTTERVTQEQRMFATKHATVGLGARQSRERPPKTTPKSSTSQSSSDTVAWVNSVCQACKCLALIELKVLLLRKEEALLSRFDDVGVSALAYAIQNDDPLIQAPRLTNLGEDNILKAQKDVIRSLISGGADVNHVSSDSDTALLWAVKHASKEVIDYLMVESFLTREGKRLSLGEQLSTISTARTGVDWTPLRAAMHRQDDKKIVNRLLKAVDLDKEKRRGFEYGYSYLNLCAFEDGPWSVALARNFMREGFDRDRAVTEPSRGGYQEAPLATAIIQGNLQLFDYLLRKNANPYTSVIRPSIRPPKNIEDWFESSIIPGGGYTEDQFEMNEPREWIFLPPFSRPWRLERVQMRLSHRFLLEFSLEVGFRGPYMDDWVRYRTVLDHLTCLGQHSKALHLVKKFEGTEHVRIVQRAIGTGIRYLYEKRTRKEDRTQQAHFSQVAKTVKLLIVGLAPKDTLFFNNEILLDDSAQPDSYWKEGRFVFGVTPESVTTLYHLAVMGGLVDIVNQMVLREVWMCKDGLGMNPLQRVELCLEAAKRKPELLRTAVDNMLEDNYTDIQKMLVAAVATATRAQKWAAASRGWIQFLSWGLILAFLVWYPLLLLSSNLEKILGLSNRAIFHVLFFILIMVVFIWYIQKVVMRLPHSGLRILKLLKRQRLRKTLLKPEEKENKYTDLSDSEDEALVY
ncbi:MAG: hypothetical protein M1839_005707 [Geoglossum umbratile]|nr:MAG: hypothetical protein M1839_005707 [Geoglossum umbratile]